MSTLEELRSALAGRYEIDAEIAHGGSSWVFAARDVKHARAVAIKILRPELAASIGEERFLREIRVEAGLQHPNILPLFDSGEVQGLPFFVMPLVAGGTLRARLAVSRRLDIAEAVRIARQVCDALAYAHARGFVHRDVKPENVLLDDGRVLLADFGIARAIMQATQEHVTGTGTAIGTVAYMSPEQGLTDGVPIDGRSDQYSLACVLYEMLVGSPPHSGGNVVQLFARRAVTPPESVRTTRADVPVALDRALLRALSTAPAARWPDMNAFGTALGEAVSTSGPVAARSRVRRPTVRQLAVVGLLAGAVALVVWRMLAPARPALDPNLLVVLPFTHESVAVDSILNGDDCSRLLRDAIAEWRGIRLVDDMRVRDARRRLGRAPSGVNEALSAASALGAGLAIWGVVERAATPALATTVRLVLYDVIGRGQKSTARATIGPESDVLAAFAELADSLLTRSIGAVGDRRLPATRDFESLRAYVQGHRALDRWDLRAARDAFALAASLDANNGLAHLWQAQSAAWIRDVDPAEWGLAAGRALRSRGLSSRDSANARALSALSRRDYVAACDEYRALIRADALDFTAWFGLGECLTSDPVVEADSATRSGWRFRTSLDEALRAHQRAIELVPTFPSAFGQAAYQRLSRYLFVDVRRLRAGLRPSDSARFAALPELSADTLAFVPFPERFVFAESTATSPPTYLTAINRNRLRLREITRTWASADSSNPAAFEALALALEAAGELDIARPAPGSVEVPALGAVRRARALSAGDDAVRLTVMETRLLIKLDRLDAARALADSLVAAWRQGSPNALTAAWLRGPAVLTGQGNLAVRWARTAAGADAQGPTSRQTNIPAAVVVAGDEALIFAALGASSDSVRAAIARAERALAANPSASMELARQHYMEWPVTLAWPDRVAQGWTTLTSAGNLQLDAQRLLARGDSAGARTALQRIEASAVRHGFSETGFDVVELTARLWLALGDTASALRMLDRSLDSVRDSGTQLVVGVPETGGYVRSMALRAELAGRRGDLARARQLSARVRTLWGRGDALVQPRLAALERWR